MRMSHRERWRRNHPRRRRRAHRARHGGLVVEALQASHCQRAILVGHNAHFDLGFINAAIRRTGHKRNPFHAFSAFDTATLSGLVYGQTVLSRALAAANLAWDTSQAHSARYDAERTAELFCAIVNRWKDLGGWMPTGRADAA